MAADFDADEVIAHVMSRLRDQFPNLDAAQIDTVVREEVERLRGASVTDYVSVLSVKAAKKRLKHAR